MEKNITIYSFADFDRSGRVRWTLNELGLPYEEVRLDYTKGQHQTEEFLKKNPIGKIPAVEINGEVISESGAICTYLAETFTQKGALAPAPGSPLRASYLQWCYFACSSLEAALFPLLEARLFKPTTPEKEKELVEYADKTMSKLATALKGKTYVVGNEFSTADILLGYGLGIARRVGLLETYPELTEYLARLESREAAQRAGLFIAWPA
jgi:glutathione S-transferase